MMGILLATVLMTSSPRPAPQPEVVLPGGAAVAVIIGLTPAHLAAAGFDEVSAAVVLASLAGSDLASHPGVAVLRGDSLQASPASLREALSPAMRLQALEVIGLAPESEQARRLLACIDSVGVEADAPLRVVRRSRSEWDRLQLALRAEENAAASGSELDQQTAAYLSQARADPAVTAARAGFEQRRTAIAALFVSQTPR